MDILISIAATISEFAIAPIGRQLGYLCFYKRNVDDLKTQFDSLGRAKEKLQHKVDEAEANGEKMEADVKDWFDAVREITEKNESFTRDEQKAHTKCCGGPFPNLVLRHRLSRRAKKMAEDVVAKTGDAEKINIQVSYRPLLPIPIVNNGYEQFETRNQILKGIIEALTDPNVGMVGVWGMSGTGKTMLAKEVARRAKDEYELFTEVVFTTISQNPNIEMIQQEIGETLHMKLEEKSVSVRAEKLRNRLKQENKMLVLVDDVWDKFDLQEVGISFSDNKKGCKILVTSRYRHVLCNEMGINRCFEVQVLPKHEAMRLFSTIVGGQAEKPDDLAAQIVEECGGLPIAITTVASALKNQTRAVWGNALRELQNSNPNNIKDMHQKVYSCIKLSYDFLQSGEAKLLLLLCSLFQEDANINIELLCIYGIGLNLFEDVYNLEDARNRVDALVVNLKEHSLLLDGSSTRAGCHVKLHDVIRDVCISIASKDANQRMYNTRNADLLPEDSDKNKLKDSTAITLYNMEDYQYPETLRSPNLKFLSLMHGKGLYMQNSRAQLSHHFFEGLNELLVLDMVGVSIKALPASSFCLLRNLQTLRLNHCHLGDITWIGELRNLKILHLPYCFITEQLPQEIGNLKRLLSLDLHGCYVKVIPPNVISSLTRLEELNLGNSFQNWEVERVLLNGADRRNANLSEVMNLPHLANLNIVVQDVNMFSKDDMFCEKLKKYNIKIGSYVVFRDAKLASRMLVLKLSPNSLLNEYDFEVWLKRSESMVVNGLKSVKSFAYELDSEGFPKLKHLRLEDSTEIRYIVNSNENMRNRAAFPILESLCLGGLINLEKIIHDKLTEESFGKLRKIEVYNCHKLKSLISLSNIPRQLEKIKLGNCMRMKEIITDGRGGEIQCMVESNENMDNSAASTNLKSLSLQGLINLKKIINKKLTAESFGKLRKIEVYNCDKLKSLFALSNIPRQLKKIELWECRAMEEIISDGREGNQSNIRISQLRSLLLDDLPKLVQFKATSKSHEISDDSIMPFFNGEVEFPKLDSLKFYSLNFRKIWSSQLPLSKTAFRSLTSLTVRYCHQLNGVIPSSVTGSLVQLQQLHVEYCKAIKELVFTEESKTMGNISFPKLEYIRLCGLPSLERLFAGDGVDCPSLLKLRIQDCQKLGAIKSCQNVEELYICGCDRLEVLATPSTSFQNLKTLIVKACPGLTSLFHPSTAKSLSQLTKLAVGLCTNLEEIIANDNDHGHEIAADNNLVFSNLEILRLCSSSNLTSFYSGSKGVVLQFPRLNELLVGECRKMETFSHGNIIHCPALHKIFICYDGPTSWDFDVFDRIGNYKNHLLLGGDINTTIRKLNHPSQAFLQNMEDEKEEEDED